MAQFDVIATPERGPGAPFVVVLQHDSVDQRGTVVVAPCIPAAIGPYSRGLTPSITIDGKAYVVVVGELAGLDRKMLRGKAVTNVAEHRDVFTAAIDRLFTGV